jgi:hypothetical protein
MKWETITTNVARKVYSEIKTNLTANGGLLGVCALLEHINSAHKGSFKMRDEVANEVYDAIKRWDIRSYAKLKEFFPKQFPKRVSSIALTDKGWELL